MIQSHNATEPYGAVRQVALGAGALAVDGHLDEADFCNSPMAQGDVLLFHSLTVHRGLPNRSRAMRLSMDLRYQRRGEVATGHTVRPHLGHAAWDTVYAGWPERCLPEGGGAVRSSPRP